MAKSFFTHTDSSPEQILKKYFGYDHFRPMQAEIIQEVIQGNDVLVLMPTGGGKSICYQVPAMLMQGIAIVISPLIALMKDQVESLLNNGITAAFLNSSQSAAQQAQIEDECLRGDIKLLYISPEKLLSQGFQQMLRSLPVSLFAIDEAHCISGWGHDFRPEYTQLSLLKIKFPHIPVVALTATADKLIRQDIVDQLGLDKGKVFISSFDRKNLNLTVLPGRNKLTQIMDFLDMHKNQAGIIYCLSRNNTEMLADKLQKSGYRVGFYHAGMNSAERAKTQEAFLKDDIQVICATIAFGMGIDKSNVRWVIHYNLPKNMESYYQEIGRAGRDGLAADTILFYSFRDIIAWREILTNSTEDTDRQELQMARLERMQQYAQAHLCRRRILLNYFAEQIISDCGNCDVCQNPRTRFDGTILAQKALSAIIRLNESVTMGTLIDVLRGSKSAIILEKGYDKIKTYGVGADLKPEEWREYIQQMINTGILEIAYHKKYSLQKGVLSQRILNGTQQVQLVKPELAPLMNKKYQSEKTKAELLQETLLDQLKNVRKRLAEVQNVPPYIIFHDQTLQEMAVKQPGNERELLEISGIGQHKLTLYGNDFLREIREFIIEQKAEGKNIKSSTYLITYEAYKRGFSLEEIAQKRSLHIVTIQSHIVTLWERNYDIDIKEFLSKDDMYSICGIIQDLGPSLVKAKEVYEALNGQYDYFKIKLAMAIFNKNNTFPAM